MKTIFAGHRFCREYGIQDGFFGCQGRRGEDGIEMIVGQDLYAPQLTAWSCDASIGRREGQENVSAAIAALAGALLVQACGFKGPLYLPPPEPAPAQEQAPASKQPAPDAR